MPRPGTLMSLDEPCPLWNFRGVRCPSQSWQQNFQMSRFVLQDLLLFGLSVMGVSSSTRKVATQPWSCAKRSAADGKDGKDGNGWWTCVKMGQLSAKQWNSSAMISLRYLLGEILIELQTLLASSSQYPWVPARTLRWIPSGNQTWLAGKPRDFPDFPSNKPSGCRGFPIVKMAGSGWPFWSPGLVKDSKILTNHFMSFVAAAGPLLQAVQETPTFSHIMKLGDHRKDRKV